MCGFAGFWSPEPLSSSAPALVRAMGDALRHRGPDDHGEWVDPEDGLALAHRRLSIVDLSVAGHQPMTSADGRWVLVFNGEIYNHVALRRELEASQRAPAWRGHSDTETLLAAIAAWGLRSALEKSVGMFALALWDRERRALQLARDRLGEKPLYYGWQQGVLLFGSELSALQCHPRFEAAIDRGALALMLRYGYVPAPWSIHASVRKLPPACLLMLSSPDDATAQPQAYWSALVHAREGASGPLQLSDAEALDELERLLRQSLLGQRVADVPLGAFLSGGVDSSLVVAVMQSLSGNAVRTFTAGFEDAAHDESGHARAVAAHLGTRHTEFCLSEREALDTVRLLPALFSEPLGDASQIPTYLVSRLARRDVTVAISGDGGDELFCGYDRYRWARRIAGWPQWLRRPVGAMLRSRPAEDWVKALGPVQRWLPAELQGPGQEDRLRKLAAVLAAADDDAVYRMVLSPWPPDADLVRAAPLLASAFNDVGPGTLDQRMMLLDLCSYLPDGVLAKVDRAAMAASLETRVPLLDHRLVEFALRLPMRFKLREGSSKWLLRRLLDRHVPRALIDRPKMGFGIPLHAWLRGDLRDWAEELLSETRLRDAGLVNPAPFRRAWAEHLAGTHDWGYRLWPLLMFEAWREAQRV